MTHRPGSPTQQVSEWLSRFGPALDRKDRAAAAKLFANECFWRDLISFTWNIKTLEGKDEIQAMLAATISDVQPGNWQILGEATEENGVTAGWFKFETAVARGKGYLRLKAGECWTLLTTMTELKGFGAVVSWRQFAPVTPLFFVLGPAGQGAPGRTSPPRLRRQRSPPS
jgi:putative flavoprotein involved in K+ transport